MPSPAGLERGAFYAPTVLTGVTHEMRIMREEIFGPVLPIVVVDSEDEAVALANDCEFGLGASVWTSDRSKGERIARELESGMVWINDHMFSHGACQCSWGGVKESGLGRTHSKFGLYECVNVKLRVWEPSAVRDPWWHPYDETLGQGAAPDRDDPLRPAVDPGRRVEGRARAAAEARGAPGAGRRQATDRASRGTRSSDADRGSGVAARAVVGFPALSERSVTLIRCLLRPTAARSASASSARGSATSPASGTCSRRRSTSPACG